MQILSYRTRTSEQTNTVRHCSWKRFITVTWSVSNHVILGYISAYETSPAPLKYLGVRILILRTYSLCIQESLCKVATTYFFLHFLTNWNTKGYTLRSLFSFHLKITCHPPSLHNSISVSIKVTVESSKTEKRSAIRCLPWKPFHCQLGTERVWKSVSVWERPRAHWVIGSVTFCSQGPQPCWKLPIRVKHPLSTAYSVRKNKYRWAMEILHDSTMSLKVYPQLRNFCSRRKTLLDSIAVVGETNMQFCAHADLCNQQMHISVCGKPAEIIRNKDWVELPWTTFSQLSALISTRSLYEAQIEFGGW